MDGKKFQILKYNFHWNQFALNSRDHGTIFSYYVDFISKLFLWDHSYIMLAQFWTFSNPSAHPTAAWIELNVWIAIFLTPPTQYADVIINLVNILWTGEFMS